jgi:hypothetical protein
MSIIRCGIVTPVTPKPSSSVDRLTWMIVDADDILVCGQMAEDEAVFLAELLNAQPAEQVPA